MVEVGSMAEADFTVAGIAKQTAPHSDGWQHFAAGRFAFSARNLCCTTRLHSC